MGYDQSYGTGGFSYRFAPQYELEYGAADEPLGMTHRVGISYRFGGFFASSRAEPAVFSPTGEHAVTKIALNSRTKAEPDRWTLEIVNKSDEVIRRFSGAGQPPAHVQWDGKAGTRIPIFDSGVPTAKPQLLDGKGRRLAVGADPVLRFYRVYRRKPFSIQPDRRCMPRG